MTATVREIQVAQMLLRVEEPGYETDHRFRDRLRQTLLRTGMHPSGFADLMLEIDLAAAA